MTAYRDAVLEIVIRERDDAHRRLTAIRNLNEEAHRDHWTAHGLYSGIRALLGPNHDHTEHTP